MKALRLLKPKELSLEEVTSKKLPPGWCRIKTLSVGVCGSDISSISGKLPFTRYPITPGHEFSGIVTEVNQCKSIKKGNLVTANPIFSCNICEACLSGDINHCTAVEVLGVINYDGAYAEEVILPEVMVIELPRSLTAEQGAMIEAVNVAVRAVDAARVVKGSSVAIFGAGNIGLLVIQVVKSYGASEILAIDPIKSRLDVAKRLGATHVLIPEELNTNEGIHSNSFSQIIDGVGNESTISSGVKLGKMGAVIVIYGVPGQGEMKIPVLDAFKKDITVKMSRLYPKSFDQAIKLVSDGEINFDPIITHRCSLDDFPKLLDLITTKKIDSIKVIINIGGEKDV